MSLRFHCRAKNWSSVSKFVLFLCFQGHPIFRFGTFFYPVTDNVQVELMWRDLQSLRDKSKSYSLRPRHFFPWFVCFSCAINHMTDRSLFSFPAHAKILKPPPTEKEKRVEKWWNINSYTFEVDNRGVMLRYYEGRKTLRIFQIGLSYERKKEFKSGHFWVCCKVQWPFDKGYFFRGAFAKFSCLNWPLSSWSVWR